jgi:hypothetical protein
MFGKVTRRFFLKWVGSLSATLLMRGDLTAASSDTCAAILNNDTGISDKERGIGRRFAGERLTYNLSFLWFRKAATCTVTFQGLPQQGHYEAIIQGQTRGVIGFATRFRRDILTSRMEEVEGGARFKPLEFREDVIIGKRQRKKVTRFDQKNNEIVIRRERRGAVKQKTIPLPRGETYYDPVTASYNFRFGSFGPIVAGRQFLIKTVPKKDFTCIRLFVAPAEETRKRRRFRKSALEKAYFVSAEIDKDIVRSTSGRLEGWFSPDLVPVEGTVKDVVWFGDIVGTLAEQNRG